MNNTNKINDTINIEPDNINLELNIEEIEIDYDQKEVNKILKKRETETLREKVDKLEQELVESLERLRERVNELELSPKIGKVSGDKNFFTRYKNGLKVYGETIYKNVHLLKELDGTWNPEMKCWFFPYNRRGNLIRMGLIDISSKTNT